jgi:hypothetical protein
MTHETIITNPNPDAEPMQTAPPPDNVLLFPGVRVVSDRLEDNPYSPSCLKKAAVTMHDGIVVFGYAENGDFHVYTHNSMSREELVRYMTNVISILQRENGNAER